jgi:hypothetical protein
MQMVIGLYGMTSEILATLPSYFMRVEAHESDDPDVEDCLWLLMVENDLTEGDLISIRPASQDRWYVAHDLAHKDGAWHANAAKAEPLSHR